MTEAIDALELKTRVAGILNHWPVAGLAVGVVRGGSLAWFHGHGVADISRHAGRPEHRLPDQLDHQDHHSDRRHAAVGTGTGRPRRARQRLPARLPAHPRQGELPAGDTAAPAHPYRRSPGGAQALGSAPASARLGHASRAPGTLARRVLPGRPARQRQPGTSGPTPITGSPRWARSSRRQRAPARPLPPQLTSTPSAWSTPTSSYPSVCGHASPPATRCAMRAQGRPRTRHGISRRQLRLLHHQRHGPLRRRAPRRGANQHGSVLQPDACHMFEPHYQPIPVPA